MPKDRDASIDLLKTIGIIGVVAFHCNFLAGFFNLFHNPLFMFTAEIFHPHEASHTWGGVFRISEKRFFRIYLPFVYLTTLLTLIQPLLSKLRLVGDAPYTLREMPMKLLTILVMRVEGFSGPCWFLISLLEISILFETIRFFTHRLSKRTELFLLLVISVIFFPIGIYTNLPRVLDESAIMFGWYVLGFYAKSLINDIHTKLNKFSRKKKTWSVGLCVVAIALSPCMISLSNNGYCWHYGKILPFIVLGTAMGIIWSFCLANLLVCLPFAQMLALPGKCSFAIMAWHLGAFRFLSILRVLLTSATAKELLGSYVKYKGTWVVVYCLVGVLLPTIGKIYYDKGKDCLHKWINVKGTTTPDSN